METQVADPDRVTTEGMKRTEGQQTIEPPKKTIVAFQKLTDYFFKNITIISIGAFIILAIGLVVFFYNQNQRLKQMLSKYSEPTPTPVISNDPLANWRVYKNITDGYQLKVPQEWGQIEPSKSLPYKAIFQSSDGLYRFTIDLIPNKNNVTGREYSSLDEYIGLPYTVKTLKVDGQDARQPLPRAGSENYNKVNFFSQDGKTIFSLELLVGDGTQTDHRVTFEAIRIGGDIFDKVVSTFKFNSLSPTATPLSINNDSVSSPSGKACTMEAKICPDGSSVGRTGPNCEFTLCPTTK
jgi:hypothetical protein